MSDSAVQSVPFQHSIVTRVLLVLILLVVVVSSVSGFYSLRGARALLEQQLTERGLVLARNLSINAGYGIFTEDTISLNQLLEGALAEPDVLFAAVTDKSGRILARRARNGQDAAFASVREQLPGAETGEVVAERLLGEEQFMLLSTPVTTREFVVSDQEEQFLINFLDVGFSADQRMEMDREELQVFRGRVHLGLSTSTMDSDMARVTRKVLYLTLLVVMVGIIISGILVRLMTRPLLRLTQLTAQVAGGNLSASIHLRGRGELAVLGESFNRMTQALKSRDQEIQQSQAGLGAANQELADLNAHLEDRVAQRTAELQRQREALKATNQELIEATERKSRFMANLAHELRTPLNSVIGFSEALKDGLLGPLEEKQQQYIQNILTSGRHILEMSGGILDLSKIEAGTIDVTLEHLDVVQALEEIVTITEPQHTARKVILALDTSSLDADRNYRADRGKFKQIMYNLVSNALKFAPEGSTVDLSAATSGDFLELIICDRGPGIPEHETEAVFEEFRQLDDGKVAGGSGLGLSITRKLVELHGGSIRVETTPGGGATFVVRLPESPPETGI